VLVVATEYGPLETAASLNREIVPGRSLLKATLDIHWTGRAAISVLERIESTLVDFSPSFRRHQCRGPSVYHVFVRDRPPSPHAPWPHAGPRGPRDAAAGSPRPPFDAGLALAHLIEHVVIDLESTITHEPSISGITGARCRPRGRYDLIVECPDPAVGRLCLALAVLSIAPAAGGRPPGRHEQDLLATARTIYRLPDRVWTPPGLARGFDWPLERAEEALSSLRDLGYLKPLVFPMSFSDEPRYRVARV
jgi:hypothetical protein